ncbi:MAG: hypothetical protein CL521_04315, partial [Actinobacteria bacterium]|nr:hypothetical protein [Actinomycetota bacterium]
MVSIVIKFIKSPLSWAIGLIILSVVGIYQKLQIQGIISLDNMAYVYYNPVISEPTLASLKTLFLPYIYWMPLTWLTHMLDWAIFKDQFNAHLILNVILHAINSTLIFLIT